MSTARKYFFNYFYYYRIVKYPSNFHFYEKPEDMKIILSYKVKACDNPLHNEASIERVLFFLLFFRVNV